MQRINEKYSDKAFRMSAEDYLARDEIDNRILKIG